MNQWEQITFAVALAAFGWLLYNSHVKAGNTSTPQNNAFESVSDIPWYLSWNQTQGYVGPLATASVNQADYVGIPSSALGQANVSGCTACNLIPYVRS